MQRLKNKPIPPPLPLPAHVTGKVTQSPAAASPRKTPLFKKAIDNNTERFVTGSCERTETEIGIVNMLR
jgi:hypothetical protein